MAAQAFDHIAIAARSLREGADWLTDRLGVAPEPGGRHPSMGTHNMLLSLGSGEYLELIAVDPEAPAPSHRRWFGLDCFDGPPRIVGWVIRQAPLHAPEGTRIVAASRGALRWRITLPLSGQMPADGAQPMRIAWGAGAHPSDGLTDHGLRLSELRLGHPEAPRPPLADPRICGVAGPAGIIARIATPQGEVTL